MKQPHPESCICLQTKRKPMIRRQASLYDGVIEEIVCFTCGAWYPLRRSEE